MQRSAARRVCIELTFMLDLLRRCYGDVVCEDDKCANAATACFVCMNTRRERALRRSEDKRDECAPRRIYGIGARRCRRLLISDTVNAEYNLLSRSAEEADN